MTGPNLNPNPVPVGPRARFDLKKHVHEEKPFFSGVRMFVSVVFSLAALGAALAGGAYLLISGPPADFYQKPVENKSDTNKPNLSPAQEKSLQEKVTALFDEYKTGWNSGSFPSKLTLSGFTSRDMNGKVLTSQSDYFDSKQTIEKVRVASIDQVTTSEVSVTVDELTSYDTDIKNWFINAGGTDQTGNLVIKRITESEYRLVDSGGWKIKSKVWLRDNGALVQQADDATLSWQMDEGNIVFDDRRPSKESLSGTYQEIANEIQTGSLADAYFPSSYSVTFQSGGTIELSEIRGRLSRLLRNVRDLKITATVTSVEQTGPRSATATVKYSAEFTVFSYDKFGSEVKSRNKYVAVWQDQDTWARDSDTETRWHRLTTTRVVRSPIWQHYEGQTPPTPPVTTPSSASSYGQTPPTSGTGYPSGD